MRCTKPLINKLLKLENQGIISPVQHSEWAAPLVCIPKRDGSVHICGDYTVTVNQWLDVDQYTLPKTQDLFSTLAGGKHFTKLDLTQAAFRRTSWNALIR